MLGLRKGTSLRLFPESFVLLCSSSDKSTGGMFYESYLFYTAPPNLLNARSYKTLLDPSDVPLSSDLESFVWATATAELIGIAQRLYEHQSQTLADIYELKGVHISYLLYLMGFDKTKFLDIEQKSKCQELIDQLKQFRIFIEKYGNAYTPV